MIPRETKLALVRISNLTQRMTEAEIERFNNLLIPEKVTKTPKGGKCIPGEEWNNMRPYMIADAHTMVEALKGLPSESLVYELRRRGCEVKCTITTIVEL